MTCFEALSYCLERGAYSVETISLNTSSDPFASDNYRPGSSSAAATEAETKIQRKNAKKNQAKKAQKEAEEADRLARLAAHKRGLERYVVPVPLHTHTRKMPE